MPDSILKVTIYSGSVKAPAWGPVSSDRNEGRFGEWNFAKVTRRCCLLHASGKQLLLAKRAMATMVIMLMTRGRDQAAQEVGVMAQCMI